MSSLRIQGWPVGVQALHSTVGSGNLARHVGGDADAVERNRARLISRAGLPRQPIWLEQVHGAEVVAIHALADGTVPQADAAWTDRPGLPCAVMAADCVPVFLASVHGDYVGIAHAGWRGLAAGVIEALIAHLRQAGADSLVGWIGPAICGRCYEVGVDVYRVFAQEPGVLVPQRPGHWWLDLPQLVRRRLDAEGVRVLTPNGPCVAEDADYYSLRRDGVAAGRTAGIIWFE